MAEDLSEWKVVQPSPIPKLSTPPESESEWKVVEKPKPPKVAFPSPYTLPGSPYTISDIKAKGPMATVAGTGAADTGESAFKPLITPLVKLVPRFEDDLSQYTDLTKIKLRRPVMGEMKDIEINPQLLTPQEIKTYKIATGLEQTVSDTVNFFTSPLGIATLGIGLLPKLAQRGIALAFAAQMGAQTPDIARQLGEQFGLPENKRDYTKISNLLSSGAVNTAFTAVAGAHGLAPGAKITPKFPVQYRTIEKGAPYAIQPEAAQPVRGVRAQPGVSGREMPAEVSRAEAGGGGREGEAAEPIAQAGTVRRAGDEAAKQVAESLGIKFDTSGQGRWMFSIKEGAAKGDTFPIKEGAAAPEIQAKIAEKVRARALDAEAMSGKTLAEFMQILQEAKLSPTKAGYELAKTIESPDELPALAKFEKQANQATKEANERAKKAAPGSKEQLDALNEGGIANAKKQYFNEAQRLYKVGRDVASGKIGIDEALKTGGITERADIEEMAAKLKPEAQVEGITPLDIQSGAPVSQTEALAKKLDRPGATAEQPPIKSFDLDEPAKPQAATVREGPGATKGKRRNITPEQERLLIAEGVSDNSLERLRAGDSIKSVVISQIHGESGKESGAYIAESMTSPFEDLSGVMDQAVMRASEILGEKQISTAGPGAATPSDVGAKAELAQLTDTLKTMAEQGKGKPELGRSYTVGEKLSQWKEPVLKSIAGLKAAASKAKINLQTPATWNGFKGSLGNRQLALTESVFNAQKFMADALKGVPKALDREAISNLVDNGLNRTRLLRAIAETDPKYEAGYQRALNILQNDPELINVAKNIQNYFETRLQDAIDAGILEDGIENYIHRMYVKDSAWKEGVIAELRAGVFTGRPSFAMQRVFQYDFEAEKAGYKPVKDFATRVAEYDVALNKSIADRQFVREVIGGKDPQGGKVAGWKMPDGLPAFAPGGTAVKIGGVGTDAAILIKPQVRVGDISVTADGRPYKVFDHPALRKWRWVETDAEGTPIMVQGSLYVHPDAITQINAVFGKSLLRHSALGRGALAVSSTIKQTMLDLSGFHPVQITVHGWEHRVDVPLGRWTTKFTGRNFKEIDLTDPVQRSLVSHGLQIADHAGHQLFGEGLSGGGPSLFRFVPWAGPKLQAYNHWLFSDYIPRLKMEMAQHALERNRGAYKNDLASGKMTEDQLLHMTANQANAAFGELNYEMMGRNKTTQDILRLALLAPDFLEGRGRFAGQAAKTAVGGYGREQLLALGFGAATLYILARILNKTINGQYHFEAEHAFDVMHNGRAYSLRTVQGDIIHAAFNPRSFIYTRLNPVTTRTAFEAVAGRDQFGRPRSPLDQLKDFASIPVPIAARGFFRGQEQKLWESFINAFGFTERRATASDSIYKDVEKFKKAHNISEPGEFIYDPEKDPYRQIKLALMFGTPKSAAQEIKLALDKGVVDWAHLSNYFDNYGKRPFTGSKANEIKFWQSLSDDQKKTYQEALKERAKTRDNAREAFKLFRKDLAPPAAR